MQLGVVSVLRCHLNAARNVAPEIQGPLADQWDAAQRSCGVCLLQRKMPEVRQAYGGFSFMYVNREGSLLRKPGQGDDQMLGCN